MIDWIITSTLDRWHELWPDAVRPRQLSFVLQSRGRIVIFLFDPQRRGDHLVAVAKISRRAEASPRLERAVRLLGEVRQRLGEGLAETVPRAFLLEGGGLLRVSVEQALPGDPMYLGRHAGRLSGRHRRNWMAWREWLVAFQESTSAGRVRISGETLDEMVRPRMRTLLENGSARQSVIDDLHQFVQQLRGQEMERVWRYGDAHHSNILLRRGTVSGVVDWEGTEPERWPIMDWYQFSIQYLMDVHRTRRRSASEDELAKLALESLLGEVDSPLTSVARTQSLLFLEHWEIERSVAMALLVVFLIQFHWGGDMGALLEHVHALLRL